MEDEGRFNELLRAAVHDHHLSGQNIVKTCRLILLVDYSDIEYDEEFFSTFNVVIDDHRDGVSYDDIAKMYENSFVKSVDQFRKRFKL